VKVIFLSTLTRRTRQGQGEVARPAVPWFFLRGFADSEFGVYKTKDIGIRDYSFGPRVQRFWFRVSGSGFLCPMFWILRFGIQDSGLGVRVCGSALKVQSVG